MGYDVKKQSFQGDGKIATPLVLIGLTLCIVIAKYFKVDENKNLKKLPLGDKFMH